MPLSTVCVSSLKSRQRLCASDSNILEDIRNMNDTDVTRFKETNDSYYSPTLSRRLLGYGYELPDKSPSRKEKKWSIGSLFRRKKKDNVDNNSSSEEDSTKKGFLSRKKRKPESKKKKPKPVGTFDHVVMPRNVYNNGIVETDSRGYFNNYAGKALPKVPQENSTTKRMGRYITDPLDEVNNSSLISLGSASTDSSTRKNRKGLVMIRAEARRVTLRNDTSSDEDSVSSSKFRSDESLTSSHRKSRAARTERYLRRYSKDGEKSILRPSKSDAENFNVRISDDSNRSLSRSPLVPTNTSFLSLTTPSLSGLLTIPPSHGSHSRIRVSNNSVNKPQKPELNGKEFYNQRSVSCDGDIHKETGDVMQNAQLKRPNVRYRNLSLIDPYRAHPRQPPPPPPRDPKRLIHHDNSRPNTYYHDDTKKSQSFNYEANRKIRPREFSSFNLHPSGRSTSEDYLSHGPKLSQELRPSSATPEASHKSFLQRHLEIKSNPDNYQYLTDKKPRSRKPIFIETNNNRRDKSETQKALDFWRQRERSDVDQKPNIQSPTQPKSPQMFTCKTMVQTQVFLPSVLQNDINSNNLVGSDAVDGPEFRHPDICSLSNGRPNIISPNVNGLPNGRHNVNSPIRSALPDDRINENGLPSNESPVKETGLRETPEDEIKRKSSNLEEALDELEAIYNSLRLGDEDLLERAEQREREAQELKNGWNFSRGTLSDSSFNYEPFDSVDSPRRKRLLKKSQTVDRRTDDMAYRKMNKERSSTICDPQSVMSTVSYLQAAPVFTDDAPLVHQNSNPKEPDVMLDDVVYRNVKYVNSVPKVIEPQPPFGIPLGPMTPASNSDYLHAVPENEPKRVIRNKIPDVVKDDLAFRNLRKDGSKEPALPVSDAAKVAKASKLDWSSLRKRRAVRSMSANIGCLMNGNSAKDLNKYDDIDNELTDIANAMDVSRQILKEKDNNITETRRGFLSDTDASNGNNTYAESRMNFLNSLRGSNENSLCAKPPRGSTPERKSPRSVRESTPIYVSPYEEKKLGRRADSPYDDLLNNLAAKAEETTQLIDNEIKQLEKDEQNGFSKALSDIDAVSEQAKLCEKLLESVVSSDFVSSPVEEVEQIPEPAIANVVMTRSDSDKNISEKAAAESDHDYENLASDRELNINEAMDDREEMATTPFEEHKAELIATFQELKDSTKDDSSEVTGEECVATTPSASDLRECACMSTPPNTSNNCDNVTCSNSTESDSHSSGFHSNDDATQLCSFDSLKSPRLVLETFRRSSRGGGVTPTTTAGRSSDCNARGYGGSPADRPDGKNDAWYRDPATLAVACSYGIACAHQIVALDVVAILGILFAVLSFIAALFF